MFESAGEIGWIIKDRELEGVVCFCVLSIIREILVGEI